MFWVYSSRGPFQRLNRYFQAKKFYKTLKIKLDEAQQRWLKSQPTSAPSPEYIEHEPDGSLAQRLLGGVLQVRYRFSEKNDRRKV